MEYSILKNLEGADPQEVDMLRKEAGIKNAAEFAQEQHEASERSMWDQAMIGIKFSNPIVLHPKTDINMSADEQFLSQFGKHNAKAKIVKDDRGRIIGLARGVCMCDTDCLGWWSKFLFDHHGLEVVAQGNGLYDVTIEGHDKLRFEQRTEALAFELKRQKQEERRAAAQRENLIRLCEQQQIEMGAIPAVVGLNTPVDAIFDDDAGEEE